MKFTTCILLCFSLLFASFAYGQNTKAASDNNTILNSAATMPEFPGGTDSMQSYISNTVIYPDDAVANNIQGRVIVKFVVDANGNVVKPMVVHSVNPLLDSAAVAVIRYMPQWKPAENDGSQVSVYMTLPIIFHLDSDNQSTEKVTKKSSSKSVSKSIAKH
ncbi:MAG TPA: energy transducer TonB [Flavipsychrobacter sp.]|nr:energy transducer TonB [Flavipsychrobacter sp.]